MRPALILVLSLAGALDVGSPHAIGLAHLIAVAVVLVIIGDTLLRALRIPATALQAFVLSAVGGAAVLTLLVMWLSLITPSSLHVWLVATVTMVTGALSLASGVRSHRFEPSASSDWALGAAISATPALLAGAIARSPFFLGYDPFTMAAYAQRLVDHPVSPLDFPTVWFNHAVQVAGGAYYFTAGAGVLSSHNVAGIVRVGGPVLLGLSALLLFLIVEEAFGSRLGAAAAAILFVSSPFVMSRYVMYIRENLALVFFLGLVLILVRIRSRLPIGAMVLAAMLAGLAIQTHEFIAVLTILTWGVYFATFLVTTDRRKGTVREIVVVGSLTTVFSLPFVIPVLTQFAPLFLSSQAAGVTGTLSPEDPANYIWRRDIQWADFNGIGILLAPAGMAVVVKPEMRRNALIILGPTVGLAIVVAAFSFAGAPLPTVRLILYLAVVLAILGGLGASFLDRLARREGLRVTAVVALLLILIASLVPVATYRKGTPFLASQVRSARAFAAETQGSGWTILTPFNEVTLLLFANVDGVVTDRDTINDVMTARSREELETALGAVGLDANPVYIYADKRFVRDGMTVSPDALGGSTRTFTVFTLLRESNPALPIGAEPSHRWVSGPCVDWTDMGDAWLIRIEQCPA